MSGRGRFIVLDGVDGCGKSTQAERLVRRLRERGAVQHLREPGSTALGERVRTLVLERGLDVRPAAEVLLFLAARRQMLEERVAPALESGAHVVCERFHGSTFAYQAVAGGLDEGAVLELLVGWAGEPSPDLELVLELDVCVAAARRGAARDRIEDRGLDFQRRVAAGFARYAERVPSVTCLDAAGAPDVVAAAVFAEVARVL